MSTAQKPSSVRRAKPVRGVKADLLAVVHELERFAAQTVVILVILGVVAVTALGLSIVAVLR